MPSLHARPHGGLPSVAPSRPGNYFLLRVTALLAVAVSLGASYGTRPAMMAVSGGSCRSQHFVVSAPTNEFARQVCEAAERFRRELAIEWLGRELPPWQDICPIRVIADPNLGAGGATSFTFINGQPRDWHMEIQGSQQRLLDSVLPHEITHTILATHFGRPLPRWADEGAATSVEHVSERSKQEKLLIRFLTTNRGIAFNHMFAMKEYPQDILPLYSQGYSLARYLIAQGGKREFVDYIGDGMDWNNWTAATQEHYGLQSLSELQQTWLAWVRQGSPHAPAMLASVSRTRSEAATLPVELPGDSSTASDLVASASGLVPLPSPVTPGTQRNVLTDNISSFGTRSDLSPRDGWYSRQSSAATGPIGGERLNTAFGRNRHFRGGHQTTGWSPPGRG